MSKIYITLELRDLAELNSVVRADKELPEMVALLPVTSYWQKKRGDMVAYRDLIHLRIVNMTTTPNIDKKAE